MQTGIKSKFGEYMHPTPPLNVCLLIYELSWNKYVKMTKHTYRKKTEKKSENLILSTFISSGHDISTCNAQKDTIRAILYIEDLTRVIISYKIY